MMHYPLKLSEKRDEIVEAARQIAEMVGGAELAQIQECTGSTDISAAIVRMKARLQELHALQVEYRRSVS